MARPETHYENKWIAHLIMNTLKVEGIEIPVLSRDVTLKDKLGSAMVRMGIHRMGYHFPPGLYFIGDETLATTNSGVPVIVTCNYKLTLDTVRAQLKKEAYWLLVLDTKGVNVWCAAGKGTFGTEELIFQLTKHKVKEVTGARTVILPQLGASRMTPHIVRKLTNMKVAYGPIRAEDLDAYLNQKMEATEAQRTVTFNWKERLVLTPVEFLMSLRYLPMVYIFMVLYNWIWAKGSFSLVTPLYQILPWLMALFTGAILFPWILPYLPFRAFTLKSLVLSIPMTALIWLSSDKFALSGSIGGLAGLSLLWITGIAYIALNFTGSTTFTSLSGVEYEVGQYKKSVPVTLGVSALLFIIGLWI